MAIFIDESSRVIMQGITGKIGNVFAERMAKHYKTFVGGVTPGKGGQEVFGKPVFNTVNSAVKELGANTSIVVVAAPYVKEAVMEAVDAGIKTIWAYTDRVPVHETMEMVHYAKLFGVRLIGPNSAGIVSPGKASASELSEYQVPLKEGNIGVLSKSGSLSYEAINMIYDAGFGFTTIICIGGDPVPGTTLTDSMEAFRDDDDTKAVVLLGEIGGADEINCIDVIKTMDKPVIAYISGHSAPVQRAMGHAGAIIDGENDTAEVKTKLLAEAGVNAVYCLEDIAKAVRAINI